jgi:hypothetical protein
VLRLKTEEAKTVVNTLNELNGSYHDVVQTVKETISEVKTTKKLWREGNKSRLIKLGLALIVFPEPTPISETVGACFVAAGAIQKAIRGRGIYVEDVNKTFKAALEEVRSTKYNVQV